MNFFNKSNGFFELIIIVFLISIYNFLTYTVSTDIALHAQFIKSYADGHIPFQVNFLYYFTVYAISFFSSDLNILLFVSIYVLAFITFLKYHVVKKIIYSEINQLSEKAVIISSLSTFLLIICFSLPSILLLDNMYYLANFPANVWHNSTVIFAMPFVILLFWNSAKQISDYKQSRLILIIFLIAINIVIKPSFVFVYVLAFPLINFIRHKFTKPFLLNLTPVIFAFFFIALQYYYVFVSSTNNVNQSSVKIDLFNVLAYWTKSTHWYQIAIIVLSTIISSYLFPIVLLLRNKQLIHKNIVLFGVFCSTIGLLIFYVLSETGSREFDGNFIWQTFMCSFLLFFVCIVELLKMIFSNKSGWKTYRIEIIFFLLHVLSGIYYFYRILSTETYN